MLRVYLTKREDFAAMNDAYGAFVLANTPKRRTALSHNGVHRTAARGDAR
jgi:enamine deaminase RidA (YjgF/YER057c/UK114 family)